MKGKFELHCHSHYSKGVTIPHEGIPSPAEIVRRARRIGLSGVAITDHSGIRGWDSARREAKRQGIVFIPGIELETLSGHVIGLGISGEVKDNMPLPETLDAIREQGGLSIAPHPFDLRGHGIRNGIRHLEVVEAFNALCSDRLVNRFAEMKARKLGKPMVCGSDAHTLDMLGASLNLIDAKDLDSVLKEIRRGRVEMLKGYAPLRSIVEWNRERFAKSYDYMLDYMRESYSRPMFWVSNRLLNTFIKSKSGFWTIAARASLPLISLYGCFRLLFDL
jgi:predicted metal-dependent phosphoesterase TrpH